MKNKILTTLLTFTFLLGACQEMPWKIKKEKEKNDKNDQNCLLMDVLCLEQAGVNTDERSKCGYSYWQCTDFFGEP